MAELRQVNESGDLTEINLDGTRVREALLSALIDGVFTPNIPASQAANGSIFFNQDTGRLSWKSHGGILMRFRMQLEP